MSCVGAGTPVLYGYGVCAIVVRGNCVTGKWAGELVECWNKWTDGFAHAKWS